MNQNNVQDTAPITPMFEVTTDGVTVIGPVSLDQLRRGLIAGRVPADALARVVGDEGWRPVAVVLAEAQTVAERPQPVASPPTSETISPRAVKERSNWLVPGAMFVLALFGIGAMVMSSRQPPTTHGSSANVSSVPRPASPPLPGVMSARESTSPVVEVQPVPPPSATTAASASASAEVPSPVPTSCSLRDGFGCEKPCGGGDQKACVWWALALWETKEKPQRKQAVSILRGACTAGYPRGCTHLALKAHAINLGAWTQADGAQETRWLLKACEAADGIGCSFAARNLKQGTGLDADLDRSEALRAKSVQLMTKACEKGDDPESCYSMGINYEIGTSVPKNIAKARALYERACREGDPFACERLTHPIP